MRKVLVIILIILGSSLWADQFYNNYHYMYSPTMRSIMYPSDSSNRTSESPSGRNSIGHYYYETEDGRYASGINSIAIVVMFFIGGIVLLIVSICRWKDDPEMGRCFLFLSLAVLGILFIIFPIGVQDYTTKCMPVVEYYRTM